MSLCVRSETYFCRDDNVGPSTLPSLRHFDPIRPKLAYDINLSLSTLSSRQNNLLCP